MIVTIENLAEASLQDVYDTVKNHLLSQGEHSQDKDGICFYRCYKKEKELSCAAGCLIPDLIYREEMERKLWSDLVKEYSFSSNHVEEIQSLQCLHDDWSSKEWEQRLTEFAEEHNLIP